MPFMPSSESEKAQVGLQGPVLDLHRKSNLLPLRTKDLSGFMKDFASPGTEHYRMVEERLNAGDKLDLGGTPEPPIPAERARSHTKHTQAQMPYRLGAAAGLVGAGTLGYAAYKNLRSGLPRIFKWIRPLIRR